MSSLLCYNEEKKEVRRYDLVAYKYFFGHLRHFQQSVL